MIARSIAEEAELAPEAAVRAVQRDASEGWGPDTGG